MAGERAEVRERRVATIEQSELHLFVGCNVSYELSPGFVPSGPRPREAVLYNPLRERFCDKGSAVFEPEQLHHLRAVGFAGSWHDTVDDGAREGDVCLDPGG